jgi:hypothetical protein
LRLKKIAIVIKYIIQNIDYPNIYSYSSMTANHSSSIESYQTDKDYYISNYAKSLLEN